MNTRPPVNPYVAGAPLREERGFFGRQDTLAWVARELRNPATPALVLFGQRRIGKTSLLLQLGRSMPSDAFLPVYFNLQDSAARPLGQVLADLADTVAERVDMALTDLDAFDDQGSFFRSTFLPKLYDILEEKQRPVFLLDEFDVLDWAVEVELPQTVAAKALFPLLRRVMTEDPRPAFVFVVGRRAEDLALDFVATFKVALAREIWVLDSESAEALVRQAEANNTLRFVDQAVARILSLTNCHPYLTQLLCQRIWERAYAGNPIALPSIDASDVEAAVPDVLEAGHQALYWLWNGLSPAEKTYLAALAETAEEGEIIPEDRVIQVLGEHAARLRTREVELAPKDLVKRRVLEMTGERKYRFAVELFRRWVRRDKPLWDVKGELDQVDPLAESIFSAGQGFFRRRQWEDAIRHFREALEANPRHFRAQLHLGEALLELGRVDEAVTELERAYELDRDEARYALGRALVAQAKARVEAGDEDDVLAACERALQVSPNEWEAQEIRTAIWIRRGDAAIERDDLEAARMAYQKADDAERIAQVEALRQKRELAALEVQARDYERAGQWAEAVEVLQKIARIDPAYKNSAARLEQAQDNYRLQYSDEPGELYAQGIEYLNRQSWGEAAEAFRTLILLEPRYKDVRERLDEAIEKARQFEELETLYRFSKDLLEKEQWEAAIGYLRRIADTGEEYKDAAGLLEEAEEQSQLQKLYAQAAARLEEKKWADAIEVLEEIVRIDPDYGDSRARLGYAQAQYTLQNLYNQAVEHLHREEWARAIRDLEAILRQEPAYLDAAAKLEEARIRQELAALYTAGVGFQETGRWEEATNKFIEIIRRVGIYKDVADRLAQAQRQQELIRRFEQGTDYFRQREWQGALREFEAVHAIDPDYLSVQLRIKEAERQLHLEDLRNRGDAGLRDGNWQAAVEAFEELYELDPGNASVIMKLEGAKRQLELDRLYREGMKHLQKERWRKAKTALGKVTRLAPGYLDAAAKLEIAQERSAQSSPAIELLRDPVWQGIGVIVAIIIAASPFLLQVILNLPKPTPTPKPVTLCNGDFEDGFACWQPGGELEQSVECEGNQCYAVLGKRDYDCRGDVPVGKAWIKQSFQVPDTISPTLSLRYQVFSYDLDNLDFFQVSIDGEVVGKYGNTEWYESSCDAKAWDSGWQSLEFDLSRHRGKTVEISLENVNGTYEWWNTWTYVDDIEIH